MRWTYLIPRLIIIGLIWGFFAFGFDPLVRQSLLSSLQSVTGAKAEIRQFETKFFPPAVAIGKTELASSSRPGTNLVEFERMSFRLAGDPLLRRAFVIDEATVTGIKFGTSRGDNGQLDDTSEDKSSEPVIPPWLTERLKSAGDEWLDELTAQAEKHLDPETLESYRVGKELYGKWDERFSQVSLELSRARTELDTIQKQIDDAKSGKTIEQIEKYLEIARRADLLMRQSRALLAEFRRSIPVEIKNDFARLNIAQKNDREMAARLVQLVRKPNARRITESLIGEDMYRQLQHLLSWVELLREYQNELKAPQPSERFRGRDFEFPVRNPTPKMLCRKMLISGEMTISDIPTPFSAVLTDVTSDPKLHGRPALLRVSTEGQTPMELVVRHDATGEISTTDLGVDYIDESVRKLRVGEEDSSYLTAALRNMHWIARLTITEDRLSGHIDVRSDFEKPQVRAEHRLAGHLAEMAEQSLAGITGVNATLTVDGTIRRPVVNVTSDLGPQVVAGFESAFSEFAPLVREQLMTELDSFLQDQNSKFSAKYGAKYQELVSGHEKILEGLQQAHQLAMDLRSGRIDADRVFRMASETGVLKEKDQKKVNGVLDKRDKILRGMQNPEKTLQDALPILRNKLFR